MTGKRASERPFVDYYRTADISPVHQDISNLALHFERRSSLYRTLGILPRVVHGADVAEFGPGSGHNALYTASLGPRTYTLIDANPRGLRESRELLERHHPGLPIAFVESLVEDYRAPRAYEVVIAEGLIPGQHDPGAFARHIGETVKPGGILLVTTISPVSFTADLLRKLIAHRVAPPSLALMERVAILRDVLGPHLATLRGMSRPVDDYILDNITHPFSGRMFSIAEAIDALGETFEFYGSSPDFALDWRWYKTLVGTAREFNRHAQEQYFGALLNFLDYRFTFERHEPEFGRRIDELCQALYAATQALDFGEPVAWPAMLDGVEELAAHVVPRAPQTARSLREVTAYLRKADAGVPPRLADFEGYFGRGMQYVAFTRRGTEL